MKVYVQYIFQTCIFFHYLFSNEQALPNTINNYSVRPCVHVCVCVFGNIPSYVRVSTMSDTNSTSDILFHTQVTKVNEFFIVHKTRKLSVMVVRTCSVCTIY